MSPQDQTLEVIPLDLLLEKVRAMSQLGARLAQIGATRLPEALELTYSFDVEGRLASYRIQVPAAAARVPSITPIYWCAFLYENEMHDLFNLQVDGMAIDFKGELYHTTVKFAFGSTKAPASKPAEAPTTKS